MRKVFAVLMMIFVVVFFYNSIQRRQPKNKLKMETADVIKDIKEELEEDYPSNPMAIMEINNEIINMIYGKPLEEEEKIQVVGLQRMLYAWDFLELNPIEKHLLEVDREIIMNGEKEIKIIGSKIMNSHNDPPGTMRVQVVHYTNKQDQDLVREYILKEENNNQEPGDHKAWKIYGWENIGRIKTQEATE